MRWLKPNLRSSIYAIFGIDMPGAPADSMPHFGIEEIRDAMLELVGEIPDNPFPQVTRRIRYAADVQALWFLRGDLMAVLATRYGETLALQKIERVTAMFHEMLPRALKARHSPLDSSHGRL